jgi:hypothetical protein
MADMSYGMVAAPAQFGVNFAFNRLANQNQRNVNQANRMIALAQRNQQRFENDQARRATNLEAYRAQAGNLGDANDRGVLNSSIPGAQAGVIEQERATRMNALQHQQDTAEDIYFQQDKLRNLGIGMQKLKNMQGIISGAIGGGGGGAMNAAASSQVGAY